MVMLRNTNCKCNKCGKLFVSMVPASPRTTTDKPYPMPFCVACGLEEQMKILAETAACVRRKGRRDRQYG